MYLPSPSGKKADPLKGCDFLNAYNRQQIQSGTKM
jgi:hypothetical protein